jgi:ABC-type transporter Mla maintaining outer membrane lipid asymmetry ATPase subunit MlaF
MTSEVVIQITNLHKNYQGLRPLRVRQFSMAAREVAILSGVDAPAAEVLVNLVTGATLPDVGDVVVLGRNTRSIASGDEWLASLDRFGIVSPRAVLLDSATVLQNLVLPFTLQIDPVPDDQAARARALATEVGIEQDWIDRAAGELPAPVRIRAHLARAVALEPALLILEHPTATLERADRQRVGIDVARVAHTRALSTFIISEDVEFARAVAGRRYTLDAATGDLKRRGGLWRR